MVQHDLEYYLPLPGIYLFLHASCAGVVEPVDVVDNGDQTHTVSYVPTKEGPYSINVLYADEEIPRRYTSI